MSHGGLRIIRTITTAFIAVLLIGGIGLVSAVTSPSAGAAVTHSAATRAPAGDPVVGIYKTYSACNAAGARGIRQNKWIRYDCQPIKGEFWLYVEYGEKVINVSNFPSYRHGVNIGITCATFSGTIGWGGDGSIFDYAFVELVEPYSLLEDTCNNGYARVYLHYSTFAGSKTIEVVQIGKYTGSMTPTLSEDDIYRYADIYVYVCSDSGGHYRCSKHYAA
jgi:hypothetical protein